MEPGLSVRARRDEKRPALSRAFFQEAGPMSWPSDAIDESRLLLGFFLLGFSLLFGLGFRFFSLLLGLGSRSGSSRLGRVGSVGANNEQGSDQGGQKLVHLNVL